MPEELIKTKKKSGNIGQNILMKNIKISGIY